MKTFAKFSTAPLIERSLPNEKYGNYSTVLSLLWEMCAACKGLKRDVDKFLVSYLIAHGFLPSAHNCILTCMGLSLFMCGEFTSANPDWCLLDPKNIIHTLGENKNVQCMVWLYQSLN
jgi:hypothetical protein